MASIWYITCWYCSWCSELFPSSPFGDVSSIADFRFFAPALAWLCWACAGVFSAMWETPLSPHVHDSISTRQKTYHNTLLMAIIRTGQGSLTIHSLDPSYFSARISFHKLLLLYSSSSWEVIFLSYFYVSIPYRGLSNCTFTCTTRSSSQSTDWLEDPTPLICTSTACTHYKLWHLRRWLVSQWRLWSGRFKRGRINPLFCLSHWAEFSWGQQTKS